MAVRGLTIGYILIVWFVISFVTNILGPLMPVIIHDFHLSLALAGFLPFSFFLAYGLVSIPAGVLIEKRGPAFALITAFAINLAGALGFALHPGYASAIGALFVIGAGMAMLQVIINPLMRMAGGEAHFAFYSVLGQLVFGAASYVSPMVFAYTMAHPAGFSNAPHWVSLYWLFALLFALAIVMTLFVNLKHFALKDDEKTEALTVYLGLLKNPTALLYFGGIAAYVAMEQSLSNWMSPFLQTVHHFDPTTLGAAAVGNFWGLMSLGCLVGLGLLKLFDSRHILAGAVVGAALSLAVALFGPAEASLIAFPACGFFLSVMFSTVFSLGLNSMPGHHGALSGILCSGIIGGAIGPMIVGVVGQYAGLQAALCLVFVFMACILGISLVARPLVGNQTIFQAKRDGSPSDGNAA